MQTFSNARPDAIMKIIINYRNCGLACVLLHIKGLSTEKMSFQHTQEIKCVVGLRPNTNIRCHVHTYVVEKKNYSLSI